MSTIKAPHHSAEPPLPRGRQAIAARAMASDQRQRLLGALPRAVAENSFAGTTVEQIVRLAQVRRNAFYEEFADKQECFAAAYEIAQERLLGVLTFQCYMRSGPVERIDAALRAGLDLLAAEPGLARLIVVEAPAVGQAMAARHYAWLDRYSRMLRLAVVGTADVAEPRPALEPAIAGAVVSRVKQLVLAGETRKLPGLRPELTQLVLSFFGSPEPLVFAAQGDEADPAQPQSPERSSVLEAA